MGMALEYITDAARIGESDGELVELHPNVAITDEGDEETTYELQLSGFVIPLDEDNLEDALGRKEELEAKLEDWLQTILLRFMDEYAEVAQKDMEKRL